VSSASDIMRTSTKIPIQRAWGEPVPLFMDPRHCSHDESRIDEMSREDSWSDLLDYLRVISLKKSVECSSDYSESAIVRLNCSEIRVR
jgi:hypothetical protein